MQQMVRTWVEVGTDGSCVVKRGGAVGRAELRGGGDRQRKVAQRVVLAGILGG